MQTLKFTYLDKADNVLQTKESICGSLQHALQIRDHEFRTSKLTGLWKIRITLVDPLKPKTTLNPAFQNRISSL